MEIGKLSFGTMRLPLKSEIQTDFDFELLNRMVDTYLDRGFCYFDTSYVYHEGHSEAAVRKALVERHQRDRFLLATKLPTFSITEEGQVAEIFNKQLANCGVEYFDYYLLHNLNRILYDTTIKTCRVFEQAKQFKAGGRIRHLGISFHDSAEILDRILSDHPEIEFVQIALNYYDWDSYWIQSRKCYEVIRRHGKGVIAMTPVKGGMLANVPEEIEKEMKNRHPEMTSAAWALKFATELDGVLTVQSGMTTMEQVIDNTGNMLDFRPLDEDDKELLFKAVPLYKKMGVLGQYDFKQFEDITPEGMPVAGVLDAYNSCSLQKGIYVNCENNYYKSLCYQYGIEDSWIRGQIFGHDGEDITPIVRQAERYLLENSY